MIIHMVLFTDNIQLKHRCEFYEEVFKLEHCSYCTRFKESANDSVLHGIQRNFE